MHPIIIHGGPMGRWEVHARTNRTSQQRQGQPRTVGLSGLNLGESFTASRNRIPGVHDAHQSRCVGMILAGPASSQHVTHVRNSLRSASAFHEQKNTEGIPYDAKSGTRPGNLTARQGNAY